MGDVIPLRRLTRWEVNLHQIRGEPIGVELLPFIVEAANEHDARRAAVAQVAARVGGHISEDGERIILPTGPATWTLGGFARELP